MSRIAELEDEAVRLLRRAAQEHRLPVDAGLCSWLTGTVRTAYQVGEAEMLRVVLDAYALSVGNDDLDGFRDTLTDLMRGILPPAECDAWAGQEAMRSQSYATIMTGRKK